MLTFGSQSKYHRRIDGTEVIRQSKQPDHFPSRLLPHYVDLRQWMTPIKDQRDMNTCTAAAFASACEYLIKRQTDLYIPISQLFIHFNGQTIDQGTYSVEDDGASRRSVVLGMRKFGICKEELWPYKRRLLNKKPPHNVYVEAKRYIVVPQEIPLDITAIKTCLANQLPALVGIKIKDGSYNHARINGGYLSIPDPDDITIANTSTHAVLLVGYDDEAQHFIVRNSWGRKWGDHGYFYMPYKYLLDKRLVNSMDCAWSITHIVRRPKPRKSVIPRHHYHSRWQLTRDINLDSTSRDPYRQTLILI